MSQNATLKASLESLRDQPDRLIEIILRQAGVIEELRVEIQTLKDQIKDLQDRNDGLSAKVAALETKNARQAAPFRIPEKQRQLQPQKPGRKTGHAGSCRPVPAVVDEQIEVPLTACPQCGGSVEKARPVVQYLEELPVVPPYHSADDARSSLPGLSSNGALDSSFASLIGAGSSGSATGTTGIGDGGHAQQAIRPDPAQDLCGVKKHLWIEAQCRRPGAGPPTDGGKTGACV